METIAAGGLLRKVRLRHGLSQRSLAIRAGITQAVLSDIENGRVSPDVELLGEFFELLGEELIIGAERRVTGVDLTLNLENLELTPEQRVAKGMAFADLVRRIRPRWADDLGSPLEPASIFLALDRYEVDFVVIGSIAGLIHGSAYPTYDLDVAHAGDLGSLNGLISALGELGVPADGHLLGEHDVHSFDTKFGPLDLLSRVPGVENFGQIKRNSSREQIGGIAVQVASMDDLIAMKRAANRTKDQLMVLEYVELADELRRRGKEEKS